MTDRSSRSRPPTRPDLNPRTVTPSSPAPGASGAARSSHSTAGNLAAAVWLSARGLRAPGRSWDVEIGFDVHARPALRQFDEKRDSRFQLHIYAEEWGFQFCHAGRASWIRITDIAFVHGADDHHLLSSTPPLKNIATFLRALETKHGLKFNRGQAAIATTIPDAELPIRNWLLTL